jgi:hypothetical protein
MQARLGDDFAQYQPFVECDGSVICDLSLMEPFVPIEADARRVSKIVREIQKQLLGETFMMNNHMQRRIEVEIESICFIRSSFHPFSISSIPCLIVPSISICVLHSLFSFLHHFSFLLGFLQSLFTPPILFRLSMPSLHCGSHSL